MGKKYKIVISSGNVNREAELPDDDISIRVGTTVRCDIRIAQLATKEPVELVMSRQNGIWAVECPEGLYFTDGGVRKQIRKQLDHGDKVFVFLQSQAKSICTIDFMLDFDSRAKKYDRMIDIRNVNNLVIGGHPTAAIYIEDPLLENDFITIAKRQGKLYLADFNARYGAYINGVRVDGEKELKDTDFFSVVGYSFYYKDGFLYTDSGNGIRINSLRSSFDSVYSSNMKYPKFVRNVRKKIVLSEEEITVLDPPQKPQKPKNNILMQLLPAIGSLVLVVVLRGIIGGGGSFVIFSACSMALGMVTTIISFITGNKDYKKEIEDREKEYSSYIARKRQEIEMARREESQQYSQIYTSSNGLLKQVKEFSGDLFDRQVGDNDFLCVRLGEGKQEAKRPIKVTVKETITASDDMARIPQQLAEEYKFIPNAPIVVDLKNTNAVGVVGDELRQIEMMKIMTLDLATRHYFNDLKMLFVLGEESEQRLSWLRWLPHVENESLGVHNIVCDEESKNSLFEFLFVELSSREQQKRKYPNYIVFVMDDKGIKSHPMSKYISKAKEYGFVFVFFEKRQDLLPQGCDEVISLERGSNRATLIKVANLNDKKIFSYSPMRDEDLERVAVTLSPVYSEEVSLENSLTKNITLYEMLGIFSPEDIDLESNWHRAAVYRSLAAPLGVKANDEMVYLDLHEKAHGPHGLVAGTTGSGKSELLQSYIISAAILFHPYEISFVIIDFKGGGMANQFRALPHLVGAITNIDGREIDRSLKSIKAELQKRQRLFADAGVNKIDDYIKMFKAGEVQIPLPHLVIVVDEFAELKADQPEFMKELISAARIGRSLGVHLILATQKPAGQVNEQIWSNSKFKLCLKVATPQDSNEVIKSPLAAEIREPGRAYLQVGNNEIFELFQSAYSGGPSKVDGSNTKEFVVYELSTWGKRKPVFTQKKKKSEGSDISQLDAVVKHIEDYCDSAGIERLPSICLPALVEYITIPENIEEYSLTSIPIGIYDNPDSQYQGYAYFDFCNENTLIIGSTMTGKTNLIQSIIRMVSSRFTPKEAAFYIADFGTMYLKNFEQLKHVGGVVTLSEEEKLKNLFKLLVEEVQIRKAKFVQKGLSSYSAYCEAGFKDLPHIFFVIDNFSAFKEMYADSYEDQFLLLCREGLACGISIIIANASTSGIGYRYLSNFACRLALKCNDTSEYSSVFDRCRMEPKDTPGRMLCRINKELFEMQSFIAFEGEKEIERSTAVKEFITKTNAMYPDMQARRIPSIPDVLNYAYIRDNFSPVTEKYKYPIALDYSSVSLVTVDFKASAELCIIGKNSGRKLAALNSLLQAIHQDILKKSVKMFIIDGIERPLKSLSRHGYVEKYTVDYSEIGSIFEIILPELESRRDLMTDGETDALAKCPLILVIINNKDAIEYISASKELMEMYTNISKRYRGLGVACVFSDIEDAAVSYSGPELLKRFKESKKAIITSSIKDFKFCDLPASHVRGFKSAKETDAFVLDGSDMARIKLVEGE